MELELRHIRKQFGSTVALEDFSMVFKKGIYGILGPNGAGKSTIINLITDNLKRDKDGGEILYNGEDILSLGKNFRKLVGYMPQQQGFYDQFSARAFLKYMAQVKEIPRGQRREEIDRLLNAVGLADAQHRKVGGFSGGMKQRVLLAQALLGDPKILILDEPTAGLDPKERIRLRNFIAELSQDKIILFATHVVSDIECIADEVLLIKKGQLVKTGSPVELIHSVTGKVAEVVCEYDEAAQMQKNFATGNIRQTKASLTLRLVKRQEGKEFDFPENSQVLTDDINLEDVYLFYLGE